MAIAFRILTAIVTLATAGPSAAAVLFDNGAFSGPGDYRNNACHVFTSTGSGCQASVTVADDFVLDSGAVITGFVWHQHELHPQNYLNTHLQILSEIPTDEEFIEPFVVYSTHVVAGRTLTPAADPIHPGYFEAVNTVSGLSVALNAGRYWLAISNDWQLSGTSSWSETLGSSDTLAGRYQWVTNGNTRFWGSENSAFQVLGDRRPVPVPEPATLALVGAALFGVAATRRRKPAPGSS